jgi:hypothetical protein
MGAVTSVVKARSALTPEVANGSKKAESAIYQNEFCLLGLERNGSDALPSPAVVTTQRKTSFRLSQPTVPARDL